MIIIIVGVKCIESIEKVKSWSNTGIKKRENVQIDNSIIFIIQWLFTDERIIHAAIEQCCHQSKPNLGCSKHNPSWSFATIAVIPNHSRNSRYRFSRQIHWCWCRYCRLCWLRYDNYINYIHKHSPYNISRSSRSQNHVGQIHDYYYSNWNDRMHEMEKIKNQSSLL